MTEKLKKEVLILKETLADLDNELDNLRKQKRSSETKLSNTLQEIVSTQNEEARLRTKIEGLVGQEGQLEKKKVKIKEKIASVKEKIAKVSKIKEDLAEVD